MTRTDAFIFAARKVIERQRGYIDGSNVRSIQLHIALDEHGKANVTVTPRTEETVIGCFDGNAKVERYSFST